MNKRMKSPSRFSFFASYPDVVILPEFRKMLGEISRNTANKLIRENRVKHFYIQNTFLIPKSWVD